MHLKQNVSLNIETRCSYVYEKMDFCQQNEMRNWLQTFKEKIRLKVILPVHVPIQTSIAFT